MKQIQEQKYRKMTKLPFISCHFSFLFTKLLLLTLPFVVISQPTSSELETLLKIRQQWGNQPPFQSWSTTISFCNWPGINCIGSETVTTISLIGHNITGTIPPSICDLKNLTVLNLKSNNIHGKFPTYLYNCTKLQKLDLSSNYFTGPLPHDINRLSSGIQHLILSDNNFTGDIPPSLAQLKWLITLNLDSNMINGVLPSELGNLGKLEELALAYNEFYPTRLPREFGMLKSLKFLWMTQCNLIAEIPGEFGNLSSLEHLDLVNNDLVGEIPSGLLLLKNLTYLYLYKNQMSGEIPTKINAFNLVEFDVSENNFTGVIPEGIADLKKLEKLHLFQNQFNGPIPSSIALLPSLKTFMLFQNRFSGTLPPEMGLHSKLNDFDISDNAFVGKLPEYLCNGRELMGVVAFNNYLNGTIPISLGECNSLNAIMLYNNSLSGEVPKGIWSLKHMMIIQLSDNELLGELPDRLAVNLSRIELSNNQFSGTIPQGVNANWKNLQELKASDNMITGSVILELTSLSQLNLLLLDGNQLTGELPSDIISWKRLTSINLARNKLSGPIPSALGSLPVLNDLDLSDNHFSGKIPPELGQLELTSLNLSCNFLTGSIPYRLDNNAYKFCYMNTHLCSKTGYLELPRCSIHGSKLSSKYLPLIIVLTLVAFISIVYFIVFLSSEIKQRNNKQDLKWNMTSFHKLDFPEEKIFNNLIEDNLIGRGGAGEVYKIPIDQTGTTLAVKRIWNNKKRKNGLEKAFAAEIDILGAIRHSNIVKLFCYITSENSRLLVYEYMEYQSLDIWIHTCKDRSSRRGSFIHWPARMKIAIDAAKGLSYMHNGFSTPIVHRDVKSSNILLDSEFNAKIADFGLAKILAHPGENQDPTSVLAGTFGYMAPEYCQTRKVNEKIDIYSFGVVLLELVTGKQAHIGDEYSNLADWARRHEAQGYPIEDALDEEVIETCYLEEMSQVFRLGLMCTSPLPSYRPPMKDILRLLQKFKGTEASRIQDLEVFPLLGSNNYISSCKSSMRTENEIV